MAAAAQPRSVPPLPLLPASSSASCPLLPPSSSSSSSWAWGVAPSSPSVAGFPPSSPSLAGFPPSSRGAREGNQPPQPRSGLAAAEGGGSPLACNPDPDPNPDPNPNPAMAGQR